jgi:hypothetical protein
MIMCHLDKIPSGLFIMEHVLIFCRSDLMVDFEDMLQKIKDLGGEYKEEIDADKEKQTAMRKQNEAAVDIVKAKIKKLEAALTQDMPFQVESLIGEVAEVASLTFGGRVSLIKTPKNKINVRVHNMGMRKEWESSYKDADPDLLIMITDQKLDEFLNKIQEELKKRLS